MAATRVILTGAAILIAISGSLAASAHPSLQKNGAELSTSDEGSVQIENIEKRQLFKNLRNFVKNVFFGEEQNKSDKPSKTNQVKKEDKDGAKNKSKSKIVLSKEKNNGGSKNATSPSQNKSKHPTKNGGSKNTSKTKIVVSNEEKGGSKNSTTSSQNETAAHAKSFFDNVGSLVKQTLLNNPQTKNSSKTSLLSRLTKFPLIGRLANKIKDRFALPTPLKKLLEFIAGAEASIRKKQFLPFLLNKIQPIITEILPQYIKKKVVPFITKKVAPFIIKYVKLPKGPIGAILGVVIPWTLFVIGGGLILVTLPPVLASLIITVIGIVNFLPRLKTPSENKR